jgi:ribonuclease HI
VIFEESKPSDWAVAHKTIGALNIRSHTQELNTLNWSPITQLEGYTVAFFDEASIRGGMNYGDGGVIKLPYLNIFRWHINCGIGTNTKAELMGAWVTLTLSKLWNITKIQVMGDSKVIIDLMNQKDNLHAIDIEGWKRRTKVMITNFQEISFHHIFRDFNKEVDRISKQGLQDKKGILTYYTVGQQVH